MVNYNTNSSPIDQGETESLAFALNAAGIGIWDFRLGNEPSVVWDERCKAFFGISKDNHLSYEDALKHIHPDDQQVVDDAVKQALDPAAGGGYDVRCRSIGAEDGILRHLWFTGKAFFDEDGNAQRFSGIVMDVSSEVRALEDQQKLQYLVNNSPDFMGISNHLGEIEYLNPKAYDLVGIDLDTDLKTIRSQDFYYPEEYARIQEVYKTVKENSSWAGNVTVRHFKTGEPIPCYGTYETVLNSKTGLPIGRSATLKDLREELRSQKALADSEFMFRNVTQNAPIGLWMSDAEGGLIYLNETLTNWTGMPYESLLGHGWGNAVVEEDRQRSGEIFLNAVNTRTHYDVEFRITKGDGSICWCRAAGDPYYNEDGSFGGYAGFCMDIHQLVEMSAQIRESEEQIRNIVEQAPVAISMIKGKDMIVESVNETILKLWGKDQSIVGKTIFEALPEIDGQGFFELLENVYTTGTPYYGYDSLAVLNYEGQLQDAYFDFVYKPIRDAQDQISGILIVATDVTRQVLAKQAVEQSEMKFRSLIEEAPVPTSVFVGKEMIIDIVNKPMLEVWGKDESVIGKPLAEGVPELVGQPFLEILDEIYATGIPYSADEARAELEVNGKLKTFYFNFTYKPLFDKGGKVYAIIDMAVDITQQVLNKQKITEAESQLRSAIENARLGTWEVHLDTNRFVASDRLKGWYGFLPEEEMTFEDVMAGVQETEMLVSAVTQASTGHRDGRLDIEYTIVNRRNMEQYVVESQGQIFFDADQKPLLIIGSTRDITLQKQYALELERLVQKRTEELQATNEEIAATNEELADANENLFRSNEELAQYAYVASHDLQEPLRKIRMFADILGKHELSDTTRPLVEKINKSSERMTLLIRDLLEFSSLSRSENILKPVDLNQVVKDVTTDFELVISEKSASIHLDELPVINAVSLQMNQLFYNLFSNALKFTGSKRSAEIKISSRVLSPEEVKQYIPKPVQRKTYHHIVFSDNGIGFDPEYAEQIFEVFKRLHGKDIYPGSGIGLALCRRIVLNHGGYLYAESVPGEGTVFNLILLE